MCTLVVDYSNVQRKKEKKNSTWLSIHRPFLLCCIYPHLSNNLLRKSLNQKISTLHATIDRCERLTFTFIANPFARKRTRTHMRITLNFKSCFNS